MFTTHCHHTIVLTRVSWPEVTFSPRKIVFSSVVVCSPAEQRVELAEYYYVIINILYLELQKLKYLRESKGAPPQIIHQDFFPKQGFHVLNSAR